MSTAKQRILAALEMGRIRKEVMKPLTMWEITNLWLSLDLVGAGFEVATWRDSVDDQRRARVVIGQYGFEKHAWRGAQVSLDRRPWVDYTGG